MRRHKPSPATLIAILALFVALGGTAIAANRYVITRPDQIKPSVMRALAAASGGSDKSVITRPVTVAAGTASPVVVARCLKGEHIISGGDAVALAPGAYVAVDTPTAGGWVVQVNAERSTQASTVQAVALCGVGTVPVARVTK